VAGLMDRSSILLASTIFGEAYSPKIKDNSTDNKYSQSIICAIIFYLLSKKEIISGTKFLLLILQRKQNKNRYSLFGL